MGWANRITVIRAGMTLAIFVLLAVTAPSPSPGVWWVTFVLFVITAVTDIVDGAIARRLGEVSVFGRIADPLVDKLLVLGTMVMLLGLEGIPAVLPPWAVTLIVTRELVVTALRGAVEGTGRSFQAVPLGKGKMLVQCVAVGAVILHGAGSTFMREELAFLSFLPGPADTWNPAHVLVWLATLMTVLSGLDYARRAVRLLRGD
ncbi:MAG: CDP-diacylglycerol--glycerol-3-phosphate 3-phosphatidyltransferase [Planctomycetota bacterium]|jgi:CDP-diacylglycerol--glycerol-3-phosphate 3-phosphatidyltransferase